MIEKFADTELTVARNPLQYYLFLDIVNSVDEKQKEKLREIHFDMLKEIKVMKEKGDKLEDAASDFMQETRQSLKLNRNLISTLEQEDDTYQKFHNDHLNFVVMIASLVKTVSKTYQDVNAIASSLNPPSTMTVGKRKATKTFDNLEELMGMRTEMDINGPAIERWVKDLAVFYNNYDVASHLAAGLYQVVDKYYKMLVHRHTREGIKIHKDAVITDVAYRIFENIDSHGEVESGRDAKTVSAYTLRKAEMLTAAIKDDMVFGFISDPNTLFEFIEEALKYLEGFMKKITDVLKPQIDEIFAKFTMAHETPEVKSTLKRMLGAIKDTNPLNVSYVESNKMKTETETMADDLTNETIAKIVEMLGDAAPFQEIVKYVLERKAELKKFFHEENSFYTCKISEGNPFMGQAPGALEVIPAQKPRGDISKILGSGFDEVREFSESIKASAKWHDLFMATSPSGSTDKSNILLIGPQGCGKTEVMRAIGAAKDSIGIFAQGSDFQTCWKGEAEKNPKRLFEAGIKINKESGKHVHFLIDEIDAVLNNDRDHSGGSNLTLEFQILMDGVVSYPNLSVWGATNNPERIPMPMIRRFSKVLIVGELDQSQRVKLLRDFLGYMPLADIEDVKWNEWGRQLEGATGDVIRKIADYLWRKKLNQFVNAKPTEAEAVIQYLNSKGKFELDKFDRVEFKKVLGKHFRIGSSDIMMSVDENLSNMAVRSEIKTAVQTYERARLLLENLKGTKITEPKVAEMTAEEKK